MHTRNILWQISEISHEFRFDEMEAYLRIAIAERVNRAYEVTDSRLYQADRSRLAAEWPCPEGHWGGVSEGDATAEGQ